MRRQALLLAAVAILVGMGIWISSALGETGKQETDGSPMTVYPSFSTRMDSPSFCVGYENVTSQPIDLPAALARERIVLDGAEYARRVRKFAGATHLPSGRTSEHTVTLRDFLPQDTPLRDGKHTLIVEFNGRKSDVIVFAWYSGSKKAVEATLFPDTLAGAAYETYTRHARAVSAGTEQPSTDIPHEYWTEKIKALKPLRVYTHRANIVVVQTVTRETETGKYIYIPVSSYLPRSGDDRFVFTPAWDMVYDYTRKRGD
jgi:hypothetical protein